jgi:hypothetical protein
VCLGVNVKGRGPPVNGPPLVLLAEPGAVSHRASTAWLTASRTGDRYCIPVTTWCERGLNIEQRMTNIATMAHNAIESVSDNPLKPRWNVEMRRLDSLLRIFGFPDEVSRRERSLGGG